MQRQNQYTAHTPTDNKYVHLHQCTERVKHAYALTSNAHPYVYVHTHTHIPIDSETNTSDRAKGATTEFRCACYAVWNIPNGHHRPGDVHTHEHAHCCNAVLCAASLKSLLLQRAFVLPARHIDSHTHTTWMRALHIPNPACDVWYVVTTRAEGGGHRCRQAQRQRCDIWMQNVALLVIACVYMISPPECALNAKIAI